MADDEEDIDAASLNSMRAVWRSMRDEDPPAAGMSALLAAAREKAEQMREPPSVWARLFDMLRKPPALAFATVLILIGGAVLVTRNSDKKVESQVADEAQKDLATREVEVATPAVTPDPAYGSAQAGPAPEVVAQPEAPPTQKPPPANPTPKRNKPAKLERTPADGERPEPNRYERFETDDVKGEVRSEGKGLDKGDVTKDEVSGNAIATPGRVAPEATKRPVKTAPPPAEEPVTVKEAAPEIDQTTTLSDAGKKQTPQIEQLARQAESAATRGDCAAVKVIVARIKKQDESFFKSRLGKNAAVTKCL